MSNYERAQKANREAIVNNTRALVVLMNDRKRKRDLLEMEIFLLNSSIANQTEMVRMMDLELADLQLRIRAKLSADEATAALEPKVQH